MTSLWLRKDQIRAVQAFAALRFVVWESRRGRDRREVDRAGRSGFVTLLLSELIEKQVYAC